MKYYYIFMIVFGCIIVAICAIIYFLKLIHQEIDRRVGNGYDPPDNKV